MDVRRLITGKPKHNFPQIKQLKIGQNESKYKKYYKNTKKHPYKMQHKSQNRNRVQGHVTHKHGACTLFLYNK